ncbi:hypothetical protein Hypma_003759 [Hypsizygus marmoreus]|uniref:Uncharacterized protein n=1 Tax=Hypsizygus marmoreus TaxID=39966 RepID=A0A369J2Y1_HYPMA|nr:hypothetical protein Hypma_003759 [Hypsizygus marmoreus]
MRTPKTPGQKKGRTPSASATQPPPSHTSTGTRISLSPDTARTRHTHLTNHHDKHPNNHHRTRRSREDHHETPGPPMQHRTGHPTPQEEWAQTGALQAHHHEHRAERQNTPGAPRHK